MREKNIIINKLHIRKTNIVKLFCEVLTDTKSITLTTKIIKRKRDLEISKKAFYSLFEEETSKYLMELDKSVNDAYQKVCKKTPFSLRGRRLLITAVDSNGKFIPSPESGKMYQGIYRLKREEDEFIPDTDNKLSQDHYKKEDELLDKYYGVVRELGKKLYIQEEAIKQALLVALKNKDSYNAAIELAYYLEYINSDEKDSVRGKIISKKRSI